MTTVRLQKVGNAIMATIPRLLLNQLRMLRGDTVRVELQGQSIVMTPVDPRPVGLSPVGLIDRRRDHVEDPEGE